MIIKFTDPEDESKTFWIETKAKGFNAVKTLAEEVKASLDGEDFETCMKKALTEHRFCWREASPLVIEF